MYICWSLLNLSKLIIYDVIFKGRGMNAAFAIGRLCDMDQGRKRLLQLNDSERMVCLTKYVHLHYSIQ
jgi:hypothetical protein